MKNAESAGGLKWTKEMLRQPWVRIAGAVVVLLLVAVAILPFFVNADTFRPTIEQKISAALGRPVTLGHVGFSVLSGSLVADNVAIADDPGFSSAPFFQARSLHIGVSTGALLFARQVRISSLIAESPQIHLISKPDGTWNYASLGASKSGAADLPPGADSPGFSTVPLFEARSQQMGVRPGGLLLARQVRIAKFAAGSPQIHLISKTDGTLNYASLGASNTGAAAPTESGPDVSIGELKIKDGNVDVSSVAAPGRHFVYNHVNATVKNLSYATPMPFELTGGLPGGGTVKLTGTAGPIAQPNAMDTPLQATVEMKHFDPVAAGMVAPSDGLSAIADLSAQINSDGKTLTTTGKLTATGLKISANGSPAKQPVNADLTMTGDLAARTGQISDLAVHTRAMAAHLKGTYQMNGDTVSLNLQLYAPGLPVDGLEQFLPAAGIKLPSGASLEGGTLTANLAITGTPAALRIAGPFEVDNTRLDGFSLVQKIGGMASAAGSNTASNAGNATDIRKLSANLVSTQPSTQLSQIDCEVPALGTATGSGSVEAGGALNFRLLARLGAAATGAPSAGSTGSLTSSAGGLLHTATASGIPLLVSGTTANPSFRLDLGSMLKQQAGGLAGQGAGAKSGALGAAQGLFNKK
jgi:AsmA protein